MKFDISPNNSRSRIEFIDARSGQQLSFVEVTSQQAVFLLAAAQLVGMPPGEFINQAIRVRGAIAQSLEAAINPHLRPAKALPLNYTCRLRGDDPSSQLTCVLASVAPDVLQKLVAPASRMIAKGEPPL